MGIQAKAVQNISIKIIFKHFYWFQSKPCIVFDSFLCYRLVDYKYHCFAEVVLYAYWYLFQWLNCHCSFKMKFLISWYVQFPFHMKICHISWEIFAIVSKQLIHLFTIITFSRINVKLSVNFGFINKLNNGWKKRRLKGSYLSQFSSVAVHINPKLPCSDDK